MEAYLEYGIFGLKVIDIIISIVIISLSFLGKTIFSKTILEMLKRFTKKTKTTIDDDMLEVLESPLKLSFILLGFYMAKEWLKIEGIEPFLNSMIKSFMIFIIFLIFYKALDKSSNIVKKFSLNFGKELSADIENFIIKTFRIIIIIIGAMSILSEWGINVSAFVASLGLVGMALALAAKDTAANLFGSLVIFTDRPFRIGDWVLTPDVEGTVEEIGIRSTKIRTFAQALVNVPNAVIANTAITNWSRMGKRRIKMRLGLTYSTTTTQMEKILEELRALLKNHKDVHQDSIMVNFDEFEGSSLSVFCYFFTTTTVWKEYLNVREDINLKMMKIVEQNDASFAFPSQSIYFENLPENKMI
ncbi:mechanosensitive ion channel family protein [Sulfurospirillum arcachonense]|uniref:mechanosensitive ion channel family protein n=1 Tax=Sulfurospirillum arcachonense TaxID=57666 RepID=UPI0004AD046D|nr:mechanosensitive ion channel family protein [Sulfurospirillum arcachonense]